MVLKLLLTITADTPDTLYYYCVNHTGMGGEIKKVKSYPITQTIINDTVIVSGVYVSY